LRKGAACPADRSGSRIEVVVMMDLARPRTTTKRARCTRELAVVALTLLMAGGALRADTVVLKDGTILEGKIVSKSTKYLRLETRFGRKSLRRADIDRLVEESEEDSALHAIRQTHDFDALPAEAQVLKNAQALYDLGRFSDIPPLVEPLVGKGSKFDDMRIRWLLIDNHIRQGQWAETEALLKKTQEDGRETDKIRAEVYLNIFKENPGHNLRKIGEVRTRDFMEWDLYLQAKEPDSLRNPKIMEAALREILRQRLHDKKNSIAAFKDELKVEETVSIIQKELDKDPKERKIKSFVKLLPYLEKMEAVEKAQFEADAVIPGASRGFQLHLVRVESDHLRDVLSTLLGPVVEAFPGDKSVPTDAHGRLTKEGREQWRKMSDEFLERSRPVIELMEYQLSRLRAFPDELKPLIKLWEDVLERVEQMKQNTVRNYERST
jgi:hypothetical protein